MFDKWTDTKRGEGQTSKDTFRVKLLFLCKVIKKNFKILHRENSSRFS